MTVAQTRYVIRSMNAPALSTRVPVPELAHKDVLNGAMRPLLHSSAVTRKAE